MPLDCGVTRRRELDDVIGVDGLGDDPRRRPRWQVVEDRGDGGEAALVSDEQVRPREQLDAVPRTRNYIEKEEARLRNLERSNRTGAVAAE